MAKEAVDILYLSAVGMDVDLMGRFAGKNGLLFASTGTLSDFTSALNLYQPRAIVLSGRFPNSPGMESDFWLPEAVTEVNRRDDLRGSKLAVYSADERAREFARERGLNLYDKANLVTPKDVCADLKARLSGGEHGK